MRAEVSMQRDFFTMLDKVSGFAILNLLWVGCSLFLVTLPAATVGLFAVLTDWIRGKESEAFERFFSAIRSQWWKGTVIVILDAVLLGVVALNLTILPRTGLSGVMLFPAMGITALVGVLAVTANLYLWPLLVTYNLPLVALAKFSLWLVLNHAGWSLMLLALSTLVLGIGMLLPAALVVLLVFSSCVYLISWGAWRIIQRYDTRLQQVASTG